MTKEVLQRRLRENTLESSCIAIKLLLWLDSLQEHQEIVNGESCVLNGVGFNKVDSPILMSIAEQFVQEGHITPKQLSIVKEKMFKYSGQVMRLVDDGYIDKHSALGKKISEHVENWKAKNKKFYII